MGGKFTPQATFCAAISKPLGINGRVSTTFPEYKLVTRWRSQTISVTIQKSNMAAGQPGAKPIKSAKMHDISACVTSTN